jgi:uncharacterized repeat protein (TIGR01451 family)
MVGDAMKVRMLARRWLLGLGTISLGVSLLQAENPPAIIGANETPIAESSVAPRLLPELQPAKPVVEKKTPSSVSASYLVKPGELPIGETPEQPKIKDIPAKIQQTVSQSDLKLDLPPIGEVKPTEKTKKSTEDKESTFDFNLPPLMPPITPKTETQPQKQEIAFPPFPKPIELPKIEPTFTPPTPAPVAPKVESIAAPIKEVAPAPIKEVVKPVPQIEVKAPTPVEIKMVPSAAPTVVPEATLREPKPTLSVEVLAPESAGLNQSMKLTLVVRNVGPVVARQVRVEDELPDSVQYQGGEPQADVNKNRITWHLGTMQPSEERKISVQAMPIGEGKWALRPNVVFSIAGPATEIRVTRPKLQLHVNVPEVGYLGEELAIPIHVSNSGSGGTQGLMLRVRLPEGLEHPAGSLLEADLPQAPPGETRTTTLKVTARIAGKFLMQVSTVADGLTEISQTIPINVVPPTLAVRWLGPGKCVLKNEPIYQIEVSNLDRDANQNPVQLATAFPEGLEVVSVTEGGQYDKNRRTVYWELGNLAPGEKRIVALKCKALTIGSWAMRAVARSGERMDVKSETITQVDGVSALNFEVVSAENPLELGREASFDIRIVNPGTATCNNIGIVAGVTEGLIITGATCNTGVLNSRINGQIITFDPIEKLPSKGEMVIRVRARSVQPGDQRCKVQIVCDQWKQPMIKEESTTFYQTNP